MAEAVTQPGNINYPIAVLIIAIMVCYVGMVYGPIGAFLAEYFPARIRYTSVSVPYHIGNGWGGGLVPFITTAMFTASGSIGKPCSIRSRCRRCASCIGADCDAGDPAHKHLERRQTVRA